MPFGTLETLAAILIVVSVVKLVVIFISPGSWLNFAKKIYAKPTQISVIFLILAAIVLYYLLNAGVTIVEILAIMLFVALLIGVGMAKYANVMLKNIDSKTVLKEQWLYVLIWIILLI